MRIEDCPIPFTIWYASVINVMVCTDCHGAYRKLITIIGVQTNLSSAVDWESQAVSQIMVSPELSAPTAEFILYCGRTAVASSLQPYAKFESSASPTVTNRHMNLMDFVRLNHRSQKNHRLYNLISMGLKPK